jgi:D-sedoheptulose 7-phosphate isomerase
MSERGASPIDIPAQLEEHRRVVAGLDNVIPQIQQIADSLSRCLRQGGKVIWMGNGGSAADAQHLAAELVVRFTRERKALAAIALTTDTSILTAAANDYSFDLIFARQIEALCRPVDAVIGISTSGTSPNVIAGLQKAKELGARTIALTGNGGGKLKELADSCLDIPSTVTARIQEAHILIGHILCDWIEAASMEDASV